MQKVIGRNAKGPKPGLSRAELYVQGIMPWTYDLQHIWAALARMHGPAGASGILANAIQVIANNTQLETAEVSRLIKKGAQQ